MAEARRPSWSAATPGIPLGWVRRHALGAARQGLAVEDLLRKSTIVVRHDDDRDRVSPAQYLLLCMHTMLGVDDAAHGLARSSLGTLYPAMGLRMALGCPTLGDAFATLSRLYVLASNAIRLNLATDRDDAVLSVHVEGRTDQETAQLEEIYLGWTYMSCHYLLGRPLPVSTVSVRDPAHFNLGRRHWAMNGLVARDRATAFRFPRRLLGEGLTSRSGPIALWECQRLWLASLRGTGDDQSRRYLDDGAFVRFGDLAAASGASPNTLRRRMRADGGSFRQARQRALVEAATDWLRSSDQRIEEIAIELGYSDERSFRRFVKNATGRTPQQIRSGTLDAEDGVDAEAMEKLRLLAECMSI